jgi:hypothetical protein
MDVAAVALCIRASPMLEQRRCWVEVVEQSEAQLLARWIEKWSYDCGAAWPEGHGGDGERRRLGCASRRGKARVRE